MLYWKNYFRHILIFLAQKSMGLINLVFCFKENKKLAKVGNLMEGNGCEGLGLKYDFIQKCWEIVFFFTFGLFQVFNDVRNKFKCNFDQILKFLPISNMHFIRCELNTL